MADIVGTLTDLSGTVTAGGTAQQIAAARQYRRYFILQNLSAGDIWINFGVVAVASQPSLRIPAGGAVEFSTLLGVVPNAFVSVIGATTSQAFTAKEA